MGLDQLVEPESDGSVCSAPATSWPEDIHCDEWDKESLAELDMSSDEGVPTLHRHIQHKHIDPLQLYNSNRHRTKIRKERRVLVGWTWMQSYQQVVTFSDRFSAGTNDQPKTKEK